MRAGFERAGGARPCAAAAATPDAGWWRRPAAFCPSPAPPTALLTPTSGPGSSAQLCQRPQPGPLRSSSFRAFPQPPRSLEAPRKPPAARLPARCEFWHRRWAAAAATCGPCVPAPLLQQAAAAVSPAACGAPVPRLQPPGCWRRRHAARGRWGGAARGPAPPPPPWALCSRRCSPRLTLRRLCRWACPRRVRPPACLPACWPSPPLHRRSLNLPPRCCLAHHTLSAPLAGMPQGSWPSARPSHRCPWPSTSSAHRPRSKRKPTWHWRWVVRAAVRGSGTGAMLPCRPLPSRLRLPPPAPCSPLHSWSRRRTGGASWWSCTM